MDNKEWARKAREAAGLIKELVDSSPWPPIAMSFLAGSERRLVEMAKRAESDA